MKQYWLVKSEPNTYSIDKLKQEKIACWDGVRNYQARNFMRDNMKKGDLVLYYHSNSDIIGVVGLAKVAKEGYPDHTSWNPKSDHYDPKSPQDAPRWFMVDLQFVEKWPATVTLDMMKKEKRLSDFRLLQKGNRLSVMPIEKKHFDVVLSLKSKM